MWVGSFGRCGMTTNRLREFKSFAEANAIMHEIEEFFEKTPADEVVENWLDSEYHRIFVTYMYPDVTKVN
jgi:hypothetical protein